MNEETQEKLRQEFSDIETEKECDRLLREKSNELAIAKKKHMKFYEKTLLFVIDCILDRKLELKKSF